MIQYLPELILLISFGTISALLAEKLEKLQNRIDELESDVAWLNSRFKRAKMRKNNQEYILNA